MANNGVKQPLLAGLIDSPLHPKTKGTYKKRRLLHSRSAPAVDSFPEKAHIALSPVSESVLSKIHPTFTKVAIILAIYLGLGTFCFFTVRHQIKGKKTDGILDSLYFCIVTMTTVGYGDLVPDSTATKLLACAFVFTGMALLALILSKAADYLVEKQETLMVKAIHINRQVGVTEMMKDIETNRVKYKFLMVTIVLVLLMLTGTVFLSEVENLNLVDSFYCVCATITTLGYGDKSFSTKGGRMFAIFWILTGTICLAQFFLYLAELNTEHRQQALVKWVLTRRMEKEDLEAADLDDDGVVG